MVQSDTRLEDRKEFDDATKDFANYMGFKILQASDDYADLGPAKKLYSEAKALLPQSKIIIYGEGRGKPRPPLMFHPAHIV